MQNLEARRATLPEAVKLIETQGKRRGAFVGIDVSKLRAIVAAKAPERLASLDAFIAGAQPPRPVAHPVGSNAPNRVVTISPVPYADWPSWARLIAATRKSKDIGVGDTVHRTIGPVASEMFKKWYFKVFGRHCGCERRREEWNAKFRYSEMPPWYLRFWSKLTNRP